MSGIRRNTALARRSTTAAQLPSSAAVFRAATWSYARTSSDSTPPIVIDASAPGSVASIVITIGDAKSEGRGSSRTVTSLSIELYLVNAGFVKRRTTAHAPEAASASASASAPVASPCTSVAVASRPSIRTMRMRGRNPYARFAFLCHLPMCARNCVSPAEGLISVSRKHRMREICK